MNDTYVTEDGTVVVRREIERVGEGKFQVQSRAAADPHVYGSQAGMAVTVRRFKTLAEARLYVKETPTNWNHLSIYVDPEEA